LKAEDCSCFDSEGYCRDCEEYYFLGIISPQNYIYLYVGAIFVIYIFGKNMRLFPSCQQNSQITNIELAEDLEEVITNQIEEIL
jgi:hypothetical protein